MSQYDDIELGNLMFGHSRGEYKFPDRELAGCDEWVALCAVLGVDSYGHAKKDSPCRNERGGYDNGTICVNPYYWGDDEEEAAKPNYLDRSIGLEIRWYKYPFRDAYLNWNANADDLKRYFRSVAISTLAQSYRGEW